MSPQSVAKVSLIIITPHYTREHVFVVVERHFTTNGRTGNQGVIQHVEISESGCYHIEALGAAGGNSAGGTLKGGVGATVNTTEIISKNTILNVVVGHHGGDAVRIDHM